MAVMVATEQQGLLAQVVQPQGSVLQVQQLVLLALQQVDLIQPKSLHLVFPQGLLGRQAQLERRVVTEQTVVTERLGQQGRPDRVEMTAMMERQAQLARPQGSEHPQQAQDQ